MLGNYTLTDNKKIEILMNYSPNFKSVTAHDYIQVLKTNSSAILRNGKISG